MRTAEKKKIYSFEMWCWRRVILFNLILFIQHMQRILQFKMKHSNQEAVLVKKKQVYTE